MAGVDPSTLFGFNPTSPYAKLFVDIFYLTTNNTDGIREEQIKVDINKNIVRFCVKVSDDEKEEGEIDDNDSKPEDVDTSVPKPKIKSRKKKQKPNPTQLLAGDSSGPSPAPSRIIVGGCPPGQNAKRNANVLDLQAQISLDNNPVRIRWINHLIDFMTRRGTPIINSPTIPIPVVHCTDTVTIKKALDLFSLYQNTMDQAGGFDGCNDSKSWKAVAVRLAVPQSKAFVLRSIYFKYLLPLEEFQNTKERESLLPTPRHQLGSSFQDRDEEIMFGLEQRGQRGEQRRPGNIMKRLGFKKKGGGSFKKFRGLHG